MEFCVKPLVAINYNETIEQVQKSMIWWPMLMLAVKGMKIKTGPLFGMTQRSKREEILALVFSLKSETN